MTRTKPTFTPVEEEAFARNASRGYGAAWPVCQCRCRCTTLLSRQATGGLCKPCRGRMYLRDRTHGPREVTG